MTGSRIEPLTDAELDRLLGHAVTPAATPGMVDRIVAEATRNDRVCPVATIAPRRSSRRPWTRRGMIVGIIAINLFAASAIAAVYHGSEGFRRLSTLSAHFLHSIVITIVPHHRAASPTVGHFVQQHHRISAAVVASARVLTEPPPLLRLTVPVRVKQHQRAHPLLPHGERPRPVTVTRRLQGAVIRPHVADRARTLQHRRGFDRIASDRQFQIKAGPGERQPASGGNSGNILSPRPAELERRQELEKHSLDTTPRAAERDGDEARGKRGEVRERRGPGTRERGGRRFGRRRR